MRRFFFIHLILTCLLSSSLFSGAQSVPESSSISNSDQSTAGASSGVLCGPPNYLCSKTSGEVAQLPNPAPPMGPNATLNTNPYVAGNFSGAGTVVVDPLSGARILRLTDGNSATAWSAQCPNPPSTAGFSWAANFSGNDTDRTINSNDTLVAVARNSANFYCILSVTITATTFMLNGPVVALPKPLAFAPTHPRLVYTFENTSHPGCTGACLYRYDLTGCLANGVCKPQSTLLYDFTAPNSCLAGLTLSQVGNYRGPKWSSVFTVSQDESTFVLGLSGTNVQDRAQIVVAYRMGAGCRALNTSSVTEAGIPAGTVVGDWGATGLLNFQNSANNGPAGEFFKIHEVFGPGRNDWLLISAANHTCVGVNDCSKDGPFFWTFGAPDAAGLNIINSATGGGHFCLSYSLIANGTGSPAGQFKIRNVANPPTAKNLISSSSPNNLAGFQPNIPGTEQHCSWSDSRWGDTRFMLVSWDTAQAATAAFGVPAFPFLTAYENELVGYPTDSPGSSTALLHRWAHTYNTGQENVQNLFTGKYMITDMSMTGRIAVFTSDWVGGLGSSSATNDCTVGKDCRVDAFLVELL